MFDCIIAGNGTSLEHAMPGICCRAAGQNDRCGYVQGSISTGSYTVTAYASSSVKSVSVSGTLYESGLFGIWHSVASCTNSSQGNRCVATGTYATKSGKSYKLEYAATFTYTNGTSETVSGTATK